MDGPAKLWVNSSFRSLKIESFRHFSPSSTDSGWHGQLAARGVPRPGGHGQQAASATQLEALHVVVRSTRGAGRGSARRRLAILSILQSVIHPGIVLFVH